jgi:FkbM family methyltransferase
MPSAQWIQTIGRVPLVGSALRWWARRYPENSVVTIKHGEAAGFRWRRHHRYVNGYWIGQYELPLQSVLKRELKPRQTFFDVGANAGFFTLVAAKLVGPSGKCFAFDPAPANIESLREQVELNALAYVTPVQQAVGDAIGESKFSFAGAGSASGHLGGSDATEEEIVVQVTTFDAAVEQFGSPDLVKMDIEGAETIALPAAKRTLAEVRPTWLIELHGPKEWDVVSQTLRDAGYKLFDVNDREIQRIDPWPQHVVARHPARGT